MRAIDGLKRQHSHATKRQEKFQKKALAEEEKIRSLNGRIWQLNREAWLLSRGKDVPR